MPHQRVNGIQLYYEEHGEGFPLVLINGLAFPMDLWFMQIRELSRRFRVIAMDNRGIGRSGKPDEEYTIPLMASDTAELLKALGIEKAHVAGLSMGGFIAQELALTHPDLIDRLILIATGTGGPQLHEASRDFWKEVSAAIKGLKPPDAYRTDMTLMTAPSFAEEHPDILAESVSLRLKNIQPLYAFLRQQRAAHAFSSNERIHLVSRPTLIILGDKDRLFPIQLAGDFRKKLPQARFNIYEDCGHAILLERAEELNRDMLEFLLGN